MGAWAGGGGVGGGATLCFPQSELHCQFHEPDLGHIQGVCTDLLKMYLYLSGKEKKFDKITAFSNREFACYG